MKQLLIGALLMVGLINISGAAQNVTVSFTAELLPGTCDVSVSGNGPDTTVTLEPLSVDDLNSKKLAGFTPFTFTLSNCEGTLPTARVYFEKGATVNPTYGYLINTGGTATNANLSLLNSDGSELISISSEV